MSALARLLARVNQNGKFRYCMPGENLPVKPKVASVTENDGKAFPQPKEDDPRDQVNFLYEPSERPYCHHASVRVDEKERQVRCKICGAVVEPFDWMLSVAKRETRLADDVRLLRQEEQERRKNIEKLIQIERNAKARIRRATKSRTE